MNWDYLLRLALWLAFLAAIIHLQYQVKKIMQQVSLDQAKERLDRAAAITEIKRTADALAMRTANIAESMKEDTLAGAAQIAEVVKQDTLELAAVTAKELDRKIDQLLARFDLVSTQQQEVKSVVDDTHVVVDTILEATAENGPRKPEL